MTINLNTEINLRYIKLFTQVIAFLVLLTYTFFVFFVFFYPKIKARNIEQKHWATVLSEEKNEKEYRDILNNYPNIYTIFISNSSEPIAHYFNDKPENKAFFSVHNITGVGRVRNGDSVLWYNKDTVVHKIQVNQLVECDFCINNNFNMPFPIISPDIPPGGTFSLKFNGVGVIDYSDVYYPSEKGGFFVSAN